MRGFFALLGFLLVAFLILGCLRGWYTIRNRPKSVDVEIHTPQIKEDFDKVGR
jgi:hypothetical protein